MQIIDVKDFNLDHTLECGQAFRWNKEGDWWYGVVKNKAIIIKQEGDKLLYECSKRTTKKFVENYFGIDDDLKAILGSTKKSWITKKAISSFYGLRILRQEFNECLLSFTCSSASNIPKIKKNIENIAKIFGHPIKFKGRVFYSFPEPKTLAKARLSQLKGCGLGFRAKYVKGTANRLANLDLSLIPPAKQKTALMQLPGVGEKIAECVLLFSLHRLDSFPIDTWIKKLLNKYYPNSYKKANFVEKNFGPFAGYIQQYLYHYSRTTKLL